MAFRRPSYGADYGAGRFTDGMLDPIRAQPDANGFTLPAPVGGWNARDPVASMRQTDAIYLDNWWPTPSSVATRPGYTVQNTVPAVQANQLQTMLPFAATDGTSKLFAAANSGIFDMSAGDGSQVASPTTTFNTTGQIQSTQFVNSGSTYLWCCDGQDTPFYYSKSGGWQQAAITGVANPALFNNVSVFNGRLILTMAGSLSFWYLGTQAIQGAATEFLLEPFFTKGGYLVATTTWTNISIFGSMQYFLAISSQGELIIFQGTDPSVSGSFTKVGTFFVGKPIGPKPFVALGTDIGIMTSGGMVPLTKAMQAATTDRSAFYTDKIQPVLAAYTGSFGTNPGWGATLFPAQNALLLNIPLLAQSATQNICSWQLAMNTQTGAWCRFLGWNAQSFCELNGNLYWCGAYTVAHAWTGTTDNGGGIICNAKQAFTKAGTENLKLPTLVRPLIAGVANASYSLGIDMDFEDNLFTSGLPTPVSVQGIWDQATWDNAIWSNASAITKTWNSVQVSGPGQYFSLRLQAICRNTALTWAATNFLLQVGGSL